METTNFQPSDVPSDIILIDAFGLAEAEVAAMCVTNYLASQDASWTTEFPWSGLADWLNEHINVNTAYRDMLRISAGYAIFDGIDYLIRGRWITRRNAEDGTHFSVTDTFVEVMRKYA